MKIATTLLVLGTSLAAHADECTPPADLDHVKCVSCGNIEQNSAMGMARAWNGFIADPNMRLQMMVNGSAQFALTDPTNSSIGNLWYHVTISDPSFQITNHQQHSIAVGLSESLNASITAGRRGGGLTFGGTRTQTSEFRQALSNGTTRLANSPYTVRIDNSSGETVATKTFPQSTREQEAPGTPQSYFNPDPQHGRPECADDDPRSAQQDDETSGGDGEYDSSDRVGAEDAYSDIGREFTRRVCGTGISGPARLTTCQFVR
ncbi:MAG: hypothetical protein AAFN50_04495 [Pseudomonadota bacterium]